MRARLQSLIDYIGLSQKEAAAICGITHRTMSRKLDATPGYAPFPDEIEALESVAAAQDRAVANMLAMIDAHPADRIALVIYRRDEDLMPADQPPFASAQRMIMARVARARPDRVTLVVFDRADYDTFRAGRTNTRDMRAAWAIHRVKTGEPA